MQYKMLVVTWTLALVLTACAHGQRHSDNSGSWIQRNTYSPNR
jgi:hypothetical protein